MKTRIDIDDCVILIVKTTTFLKGYAMNTCRIFMIPVMLLITVLLASCSYNPYKDKFMKLQIGMEKEDVLSLMGPPGLNEAYQTKTGGSLEIFFYSTSTDDVGIRYPIIGSDCVNTSTPWRKCMPILFEDGKVIGWGKQFYEEKIKIELDITTSEK